MHLGGKWVCIRYVFSQKRQVLNTWYPVNTDFFRLFKGNTDHFLMIFFRYVSNMDFLRKYGPLYRHCNVKTSYVMMSYFMTSYVKSWAQSRVIFSSTHLSSNLSIFINSSPSSRSQLLKSVRLSPVRVIMSVLNNSSNVKVSSRDF